MRGTLLPQKLRGNICWTKVIYKNHHPYYTHTSGTLYASHHQNQFLYLLDLFLLTKWLIDLLNHLIPESLIGDEVGESCYVLGDVVGGEASHEVEAGV